MRNSKTYSISNLVSDVVAGRLLLVDVELGAWCLCLRVQRSRRHWLPAPFK